MGKKKLSQEEIIARHIDEYGSISSMEAFSRYGITRLSGRIFDLRANGYKIDTDMIYKKDGTRYALYRKAW